MSWSGIFLADGPADLPLSDHLTALCLDMGLALQRTPVDPQRLSGAGRRVEERVRFLVRQNIHFDVLFVHRDAEALRQLDRSGPVSQLEGWKALQADLATVFGRR